jgi:hypothetical protein
VTQLRRAGIDVAMKLSWCYYGVMIVLQYRRVMIMSQSFRRYRDATRATLSRMLQGHQTQGGFCRCYKLLQMLPLRVGCRVITIRQGFVGVTRRYKVLQYVTIYHSMLQ